MACGALLLIRTQDQSWRPIPPGGNLPQPTAHRHDHPQATGAGCLGVPVAGLDRPSPRRGDAITAERSLRAAAQRTAYLSLGDKRSDMQCRSGVSRPLNAYLSLPYYLPRNGPVASGWSSGTSGSLDSPNHCSLDNLPSELPTHRSPLESRSGLRFAFSGVPK